ncbi:uncharacterized protein LOC123538720 [Mercenaria mercenaria]|uniref:uncharacterized protein LOC123538720 n=1 Tax=Mercenaria mercenaria TaxID=6596 RepID=UPI00234FA23B|nr:uncharacterized protein LOC123538720 [Mercenaria mercenaria]
MEGEFEQIIVAKNDCVSPEITGSVTVEVNDSGQNITVKTETETQQQTDEAVLYLDEFSPNLSMKTENETRQHTDQAFVCQDEFSPNLSITAENETHEQTGRALVSVNNFSGNLTINSENETWQSTEPAFVNEDEFSPNLCIKSENGTRQQTDPAFFIENNFSPTPCIETENQNQGEADPIFISKDEISSNLSIKAENEFLGNDCHPIENFNTASELSTKCPSCEHEFADYLQYLDHRLLCVAGKDQLDAFEVKVETDDITEPAFEYIIQNTEHLEQNRTLPEVKQEIYETDFEAEKSSLVTEQHEATDKLNIPTQAVPQLLVQNSALCNNMHSPKTQSQEDEVLIACFYCSETFLRESMCIRFDKYIEHLQKHLNKINRYDTIDVNHEVERLNNYLRNMFTLKTCRITATICQNATCNYIFVDMSAAEKHNLIVHFGFLYVCTKVDCHKVFPNKGSLRSHEIVDHAKIVDIYSAKRPKNAKTRSDTNGLKTASVGTVIEKAKSVKRQREVTNTCRICGKEFSTSVGLKSHLICDHPGMTPKQLDYFSGHCENELLKLDVSEKEEGVIDNSLNPEKKRVKLCKPDYVHLLSEESEKLDKDASNCAKVRPYRNRKYMTRQRKHQLIYDRNDLQNKLAVCQTAANIDQMGITAVTNKSCNGVNEKDEDVNVMINNILDNAKDINDIMNVDACKMDGTERELGKSVAMRKPRKRSRKKVRHKKKSKLGKATSSCKEKNENDKNDEKQCGKSSESVDEDVKHSVEKDTVANTFPCKFGCHTVFYTDKDLIKHVNKQHVTKFPCKSAGCKMVFGTTEERRKHVKEKHMYFHPSLVKYKCTHPGCFKGFYRKFDLHEHLRICTLGPSINPKITSSDNGISELRKKLLEDELRMEEADSNEIQDDANVNGNIRKLCWYICPMNQCYYGSEVKNNIYEHLKTVHI